MAQPGGNVGAQAAGGVAGGAQQPLGRPAVMPEAYEGDGDWEEYLAYFNQCADINGWNDAAKARYLGVRLRGMAQRYHAGIPQARRLNWQQVTQDFTQRFAPAADVRRYKAQFKSRRRGQDEPLPKLADDLRRLVTRAYPNMQDGDQQELVRDQFIDAAYAIIIESSSSGEPTCDSTGSTRKSASPGTGLVFGGSTPGRSFETRWALF